MWIKTFEEYSKSDWVNSKGEKIEYKGRSTKISLEQAVKLYKDNCSDWDLKNDNKIYRGLWIDSDYLYTNPKGKYRSSANAGGNTYNSLFDILKSWKNAPRRSESLIMANDSSIAESYGDIYVMIPYNNSRFGICFNCDVWNSSPHMDKIIGDEYYGFESFDSDLYNTFKQVIGEDKSHLFKINSWKDHKGETVTNKYLNVNSNNIKELCNILDSIPKDELPTKYTYGDHDIDLMRVWKEKFPNTKFLEFMEYLLDFNRNKFTIVDNQKDLIINTKDCNEIWSDGEFLGISEDKYDEFVKLIYNE